MSEYLGKKAPGYDPICTLRRKRPSACNAPFACANCGWEADTHDERISAIRHSRNMKTEDGLRYLAIAQPAKSKNKKTGDATATEEKAG